MLNHKIADIVVSKILGHSRPSTTMDIYGHLVPGMQEEAAEMMDELTALHEVDFPIIVKDKKVGEGESKSYSHQRCEYELMKISLFIYLWGGI